MHFKSLEDIVIIIIIIIYNDKNYIKPNQETSTSTIGAKSSWVFQSPCNCYWDERLGWKSVIHLKKKKKKKIIISNF